jgi:hypothetical protein
VNHTESPWNFFEDFEKEEEGKLKKIMLEKGSDEMLYIDKQKKRWRERYINHNFTLNNKGAGSEPFRIKKDPDGNKYLEVTLKHGWNRDIKAIECGARESERAQLQAIPKDAQEKEMWISFKTRLPSDYKHIDDRLSIFEFKNIFKEMKKSPLLGIKYYGNELKIGGDTGGIANQPQNKQERFLHHIVAKYINKRGKWYVKWEKSRGERKATSGIIGDLLLTEHDEEDIKIYRKEYKRKTKEGEEYTLTPKEPVNVTPLGEWSTYKIGIYNTRNENGFVKVWKDNQLMFDYKGVTFDWTGEYIGTYIRIGIYRDSGTEHGIEWHDQIMHFDNFNIVSDEKTLDQILNR